MTEPVDTLTGRFQVVTDGKHVAGCFWLLKAEKFEGGKK